MGKEVEGLGRARARFAEGKAVQALRTLAGDEGRPRQPDELGTAGRVLLGRIVRQLGAPRLGTSILVRAWRADRRDPEASYHHARTLLALRGTEATRRFMAVRGLLEDADCELRADWLSFAGFVAARRGDPTLAWGWLERARAMQPQSSWLAVERSFVLELEDRFEEALEEARLAVALDGRSRSAVQQFCALALSLGYPGPARELLQDATRAIESADLCVQLAMACEELGLDQAALAALRRARTLLPLAEPGQLRWIDGLESDAAYRAGDVRESIRLARRCGDTFHTSVAAAMARWKDSNPDVARVRLPVTFVRQRRLECAPAAAAMLARYWGERIDPVEIARDVCAGGTTSRALRAWAEGKGFLVRELTIDLQSAIALLDRGLPFALTTVDPGAAHMQVVVGYDRCRRTLLIRDPSRPEGCEMPWQDLVARSRPPGPRGLVLAPPARARELAGLELPEAGLYDVLHAVQQSLHAGDFASARAAAARMGRRAPGHPLEILARSGLAAAEGRPEHVLGCIQEMLTGFPDHAAGILRRLADLLPREGAEPEGIG